MDALSLTAVAPVALSAISALRPAPAVVVPPAPNNQLPGSPNLSFNDLVQVLLRQSLQTATAFPTAEPATGSAALAAQATTSLLAALNPPQATATTTAVADATTNPAGVQATDATSAPTATQASTLPAEAPAAQDAFAASSSLDFALGTALRFGAGVAALAGPAAAGSPEGTGLVRDAMAVPRLSSLQSRAGGPGPEAFAPPQATVARVLRTYESSPVNQSPAQLDLFA